MALLPIIPISALQRSAKDALAGIHDYAVIRSHSRDVAFVLHPDLGKVLLDSGMLAALREHACRPSEIATKDSRSLEQQLHGLIGNVLRELSKK